MNRPDRPTALHVVERATDASSEFDRVIVQAGFDMEHVETVYGAMARLVHPTGRSIDTIIVCLDDLDGAELEFFALAARRCPDVPVYIYGRSADGHRRQRALALGAQSQVTAGHIPTVLAALVRDRTTKAHEPSVETTADAATAPSEPSPVVEASQGPGSSPPARAPTPWHPSDDRPQRIPPGAKTRAEDDVGQAPALDDPETPAAPRSTTGPLLTPQEIDALLSEPGPSEQPEGAADDESA